MKSLVAAGLGALIAMSVGLAAPAQAADNPGADVAAATVRAQTQSQAIDHWSPTRMRAAAPGDQLLLGRTLGRVTSTVERGLAQVVSGRTSSGSLLGLLNGLLGGLSGGNQADVSHGALYTGGGAVVRTSGRLFFTLGGSDYACSGSSVRAANESLVQTAGHCVNEGAGRFATNVIFVPAYKDGAAPYGRFAATKLFTSSQWRDDADLNYDVGYATVRPIRGRSLADTVGAQGIGFNLARGATVHAFGYPAAAPYDGSRLASCHGTVTPDTIGRSSDQGLVCNLNGGSSGGPWYVNYDAARGLGITNSVNSFTYSGLFAGRSLFGPYFGSVVQRVYAAAQR